MNTAKAHFVSQAQRLRLLKRFVRENEVGDLEVTEYRRDDVAKVTLKVVTPVMVR